MPAFIAKNELRNITKKIKIKIFLSNKNFLKNNILIRKPIRSIIKDTEFVNGIKKFIIADINPIKNNPLKKTRFSKSIILSLFLDKNLNKYPYPIMLIKVKKI